MVEFPIIFRNDDVNPNTDIKALKRQYKVLKDLYPKCKIWSAVTVFADENEIGSVYEKTPFKDQPTEWFYNVTHNIDFIADIPGDVVASHGLFHVDHSKLGYEAQEMSIVASCNILGTKLFVPPFNRQNIDTQKVCDRNGITLVSRETDVGKWMSFEYEDFDPEHKLWYFHSWRYNCETLRETLCVK